jgi:hypothetical protein
LRALPLSARRGLRPARFVNECLEIAEGRNEVSANVMHQAEREFSRKRRNALEVEWSSAFPTLHGLLNYLGSFRTQIIDFPRLCAKEAVEELALPMAEKRVDFDPLCESAQKLFTGGITPEDFMRSVVGILYRVGAVGLKPGSGEQYLYSHNDEPVINTIVIGEASRVRIHPMLHMAMGIDSRRGG